MPVSQAADDHHDTVVILLDASGSMKSSFQGGVSRMTAAKSALKAVLQKVPQSTHVGLLVFSANNLTNDWAYPLGPRDDARLFAAIDSIDPGHDTPLGRYIKKAADRLLEERAKEFGYGTYRLLIVTDGEAQDQNLVDRYTPEVIARGITVDVIGVAMRQTHTLATKVHSYRGANDPAALNRALSEIFAEVRSTGRDAAESDAFALIAPLPDKIASAMIQAVANTPNQPIGQRPKSVALPNSKPAAQNIAPTAVPQSKITPSATPPAQPSSSSNGSSKPRSRSNWGTMAVIIVVVVFALSRAIRKGTRR
jgi:hypothetical protein